MLDRLVQALRREEGAQVEVGELGQARPGQVFR